jgi:hypothetical protein
MLQASAIPSRNFRLLRLVQDNEVLHSRARVERQEIWCYDDADGRRLPISHLPGTGLPPLRPLRHAPGRQRRLPSRRCSLHLDGVLGERGGGQAVVPRRRWSSPPSHRPKQPSPAVPCARHRPAVRPRAATLGRGPTCRQPPRLGLIAPPRRTREGGERDK